MSQLVVRSHHFHGRWHAVNNLPAPKHGRPSLPIVRLDRSRCEEVSRKRHTWPAHKRTIRPWQSLYIHEVYRGTLPSPIRSQWSPSFRDSGKPRETELAIACQTARHLGAVLEG